ncbi:MAG: sigma 54-interacting transcriptional regulator [Myxococcales bacterium]|nr:sigma 54-interacting transcriptional regulator [Myxococcales bacterium]
MKRVLEQVKRVARSEATVLVRGQSGTGKELVARAIHAEGPRRGRALRAVNCATLTGDLLASELFGHVRGAFTGAVRDKPGLFALANGGTIFLDEVAELPVELQARLLRVLEQKQIVPVGATEPVEVDVRLISATHRSLRRQVEAGRFREDLMYRIRVVVLFLPSLAQRAGDVRLLTWHFVEHFNEQAGYRTVHGIHRHAMEAIEAYSWPGNVRELRNNIEQAFVLGEGSVLTLDDLAPELRGLEPPQGSDTSPTWRDEQRDQILAALTATGGRKAQAAERLGMSRSTLWRRMRELGL